MSQLRKYLRFTLSHKMRAARWKRKLAVLGKGVWLDKRVEFLRYPRNIRVGDQVVVKEGARICACNERATIDIGKRTTIGYHTFIFSSQQISIGDDCLIAPFVYLVDSDHGIEKDRKINTQPNKTAPIVIGTDVWLGSGVTVLKGVTIADGAVVAANSLVRDDIGEYEIWAGTPAKKVGDRQ